MNRRAVLFLAFIIGTAGCISIGGPGQSTPTTTADSNDSDQSKPTATENANYELSKLTERLNRSISIKDSETIVIGIVLKQDLSEQEFNETIEKVQNRTENFRSAFIDQRLITTRATQQQVYELTTLEDVKKIDTVNEGEAQNMASHH